MLDWTKELPIAITVSDENGTIIDLNDAALGVWAGRGGAELIGQSLFNCHGPQSSEMLRHMFEQHNVNVYTVEKSGVTKLIYQAPWTIDGSFKGYIELSIVLPEPMRHVVRTPQTTK